MKRRLVVSCVCLVLGSVACGGAQAVRTAEGGPVKLYTLVDPNIRATTGEEKAQQLREVVEEMAPKLRQVLAAEGVEAVPIASREEFRPGPGAYLLVVTVTAYNPGNKAARTLVGLGLGTAALAVRHDLFADPAQAPLAGDDFVSAGSLLAPPMVNGDWRACIHDVNRAVSESVAGDLRRRQERRTASAI